MASDIALVCPFPKKEERRPTASQVNFQPRIFVSSLIATRQKMSVWPNFTLRLPSAIIICRCVSMLPSKKKGHFTYALEWLRVIWAVQRIFDRLAG